MSSHDSHTADLPRSRRHVSIASTGHTSTMPQRHVPPGPSTSRARHDRAPCLHRARIIYMPTTLQRPCSCNTGCSTPSRLPVALPSCPITTSPQQPDIMIPQRFRRYAAMTPLKRTDHTPHTPKCLENVLALSTFKEREIGHDPERSFPILS
jgi:hypothetical protein